MRRPLINLGRLEPEAPIALRDCSQRPKSGGDDVRANPVGWDDCDLEAFHGVSFPERRIGAPTTIHGKFICSP